MSRDRVVLTVLALALAAGPMPALGLDAARAPAVSGPSPAALRCDDVDAAALRATLPRFIPPRIILVAGALPLLTMESFARFLVAMGYPEERLRDPRDGSASASGYTDSLKLAGLVGWHYEHDGMPPILIGHSRGGMVVLRTLHELAGAFQPDIPVWDPLTDEPLPRTDIRDPRTGAMRPVVGLHVHYAVAIATGKLPRMLLGQWTMLKRLREVPDTVEDFAGYAIEDDLIADGILGHDPYKSMGSARVRNVTLPASYGHIGAVRLDDLASDAAARALVDAYRPGTAPVDGAPPHSLLAAEIWHGVKRTWCREIAALDRGQAAP